MSLFGAEPVDRQLDDRVVVERQRVGVGDGRQPDVGVGERPQPPRGHHVEVRDGQHAAAAVPARVIQHHQLQRLNTLDVDLGAQRPTRSISEGFAFVQERGGQLPSS